MLWILWLQVLIRGAWIHRGDGSLAVQGDVLFQGDSIVQVAPIIPAQPQYKVIEARGKHLYPALIGLNTPVGLVEIEAVRATRDEAEVGEFTPEATAYTAFNIDSRVLPTLRANGILYVEATPRSGLIAGQSSLMRLRGRTREEARVLPSAALHLYPPSLRPSIYASPEDQKKQREQAQAAWKRIEDYLEKAQRWCRGDSAQQNISFAALCPYFQGTKPVVWHVETAEDIEAAVKLSLRYQLRPTIAGGSEAIRLASFLREHRVPVIVVRTHRLPPTEDSPIDYAYTLPKALLDSGLTVILAHESFWNQRNLSYQAGTAAAYGVSPEQALAMITSIPAQWLGLERIGRIAPGYKASLLLCEGDILDVPSSRLLQAWIEGELVDLTDNPQEILYRKYR
ncbi:MAG: amidohydrolase family protein [Bacteroidia bacterium]|nr:amidohydrolase family protein [Bacteroidia bacterium]MCX7763526.1 amidohydrolase family protein [Bacteroidia bacterium]MDW8057482.1 amidohydrolase family protein [Bacteroidia bacterium]